MNSITCKITSKHFNLTISILLLSVCIFGQTPPSDILPDLQYFKLNFPIDENGNDYIGISYANRNNPLIKSWTKYDLVNWSPNSPYSNFFLVVGNEVVFRAHCAGALTSANAYPRCELRETPDGTDDLWEFSDEHELNATFRVTHLPDQKQEVCMLQIKGNHSNNTSGTEEALRLEYRQDGSQGFHAVINENTTITDVIDYSLGQAVEARLYVNNNTISIELNNLSVSGSAGVWNYTYVSNYSHGYFKAGCYTQSSIWEEKNGVANESSSAYGEVIFSELTLGNGNIVPPNINVKSREGDIYIDNPNYGIIMKAPNNTCYRMMIQNNGTWNSQVVTCPQ